MSDLTYVLVLPDRDAAEEVAELAVERFGLAGEPHLIRDALAGEDDAEDAQWLVVVEDAPEAVAAGLEDLAESYDGWLEGSATVPDDPAG
ncbi:hypothetical protein [Streptomyces sp. CMB-StM0423]|uniref:hypothetical protein n=1 Tax=Streptomyces sp. CMB-StM0423 TaxID=2059884 RepID=UPI000C6FD9BB|nr:hypothetical protein [Streptomyces sp. CMB-StM0423]AUH43045.1 hypothetical protein CXR04_25275 [Streptomyces sp. CMB-StM0423]